VFSNVDEVSEADVTSRGSKYVFARVKRGELRGEELQALWH